MNAHKNCQLKDTPTKTIKMNRDLLILSVYTLTIV